MYNHKSIFFGVILLSSFFTQSGDNLSQSQESPKKIENYKLNKSQPIPIPNNGRKVNPFNYDFELGYQASRSHSPSCPLRKKNLYMLYQEATKLSNLRISPNYDANKRNSPPSPITILTASALMSLEQAHTSPRHTLQK